MSFAGASAKVIHGRPGVPFGHAYAKSAMVLWFKMPRVVMFDGESDPRELVMSFEATVESAGGDGTTLEKAFVLAIKGIARSWYSALPPGSIYS